MQRVKTKTLLYLERWECDVTYHHFCSLQQAKVILFLLKEALWETVKAAMNCRLKYNTTFHQGLRTFQRKALHFGNKQKLKGRKNANHNKTCLFCLLLEHFRNIFCKQCRLSLIWVNAVCRPTDSKTTVDLGR